MVLGIRNLDLMKVEQISIPKMSEAVQIDQYIKDKTDGLDDYFLCRK
jgi:hypothetical protein